MRGQCHCGAIQFEAEALDHEVTICHCRDCQSLSGSAFRLSVPAAEGSFHLLRGLPREYVKVADSGARRAQAFCSACGGPLYSYDVDAPTIYNLRVGCLNASHQLLPRKQIWCTSALVWAIFPQLSSSPKE